LIFRPPVFNGLNLFLPVRRKLRHHGNPPTGIAYLHSLYGLPNVVDNPSRNHGSHGPVPLPCPLLLSFCTGKSETW